MKKYYLSNYFIFLLITLSILSYKSVASVHFTESFTSPNFPVSTYSSGNFVLSSGTWEVNEVQGLEALNAFNNSGGAVKLNRFHQSYLISPSVNSVGTLSFYYRNFSTSVGGGSFVVQKSVNNGAFTDIETINFNDIGEYSYYTVSIDDPNNNVRIRIFCPDTNTGLLCIDEIILTDMGQTLATNPSSLSDLNYYLGNGPSESQSFNLFGNNLTGSPGNITVTAPTHYEISIDNTSFSSSILVPYSNSILDATPVYVRLKAGLSEGSYNSELITISGGGASSINISCNGTVSIQPPSDLTVTPTTLSGFNYQFGDGPSVIQNYNLSGLDLIDFPGDIEITAPSSYELSTDYSTFSNTLSIPYDDAILTSVVIYVRLKAGLSAGTHNSQIITNTGGGSSTKNVICNGTVSPPPSPSLSVNPATLSGFNYIEGDGPSTMQSYNLTGSALTGYPSTIDITAPIDYEISLNPGSGFSTNLNVPYTSATLESTPIYVRLKEGLSVGDYNSEIITNSGAGATTVNVTCNGSVSEIPPATLSLNNSTLSGFNYIVGSGPSSAQSVNLSGTYLTEYPDNITVTASTNYEVSFNESSEYSNSINIPYTSGTLNSTPIYVRLKSGLIVGTYNSETISISGGGATTLNITCNGSVSDVPPPVLSVNTSSLSGFNYIVGSGPSSEQMYNISGTNLTGYPNDITITAPTNYEVSLNSESDYSTSIIVTYSTATLSPTPIYVRLKSDLSVGTYNSEIIANSGSGATTVNITCNGSVSEIPPPTLIANTTNLTGFNYILGSGPSTQQSYTLSGANLTGYPDNISISAPANYEISLSSGTGFTNSLNVAYISADLSSTTIYVRLKAGLPVGTYNSEFITNSGSGATDIDVSCNGTVSDISTDPCLAEDFSGFTGGTHASPGSDVSGTLDSYTQTTGWTGLKVFQAGGEIKLGSSSVDGYIITPTIDLSAGGTLEFDYAKWSTDDPMVQIFHASDGVNFVQVGTGISTTIGFQSHSLEITDGTASSKIKIGGTERIYLDNIEIYCGGSAPDPILTANPVNLNGFSYTEDSGPSTEQAFNLTGTDMNGSNVSIYPSINYEVSLSSSTGFQSTAITLNAYNGSAISIFVRLKAGLTAGNYDSEIISIIGGGASEVTLTCNGSVNELLIPSINITSESLNTFNYVEGFGPSEEQIITFNGTDLNETDFYITPSTNLEISLTSGSGFQNTPIVLPTFYGSSTTIFVRLKSGLLEGNYDTESIILSGGGITENNIPCTGIVDEYVQVISVIQEKSCFIYPNPTSDIANIEISNWNSENVKLEIFDMMGRFVLEKELNVNNGFAKDKIDLSHFKSGLYHIKLSNKNSTINIKINKQ